MKSRMTDLRVYVSTKVVQARQFIFQWGNTVDGARVGDTLGEGSWVPILVSAAGSMLVMITQASVHRINSPKSLDHSALTHFACLSLTSCMNVNWVPGKRYLRT
jgi:hypothetical protein